MSVGTAIFLSSVVLATVILYGITKDRWRWRRVLARTALTLVGIVVVTGTIIGGLYFWHQLPVPLLPQTEYAGLRLGSSPAEVIVHQRLSTRRLRYTKDSSGNARGGFEGNDGAPFWGLSDGH